MTPAERAEWDELAALEAELSVLEAASPAARFALDAPGPGLWGAADFQRALALDTSKRIFLRKGNKVGGSTWLHWTAKAFFDGWHPTLPRPKRPARIAYIAADLEQSYKRDVAPRLREFFLDCDLSERCHYDGAKGFMVGGGRGLETANGDLIAFFSGHQAALALAGGSYDLVMVNEPPRPHIWAEALRAAAEHGASVLVNFTPLPPESLVGGDDLTWLRKEIEDPAKGWSQHVVPLRPDTAPHRTKAGIDRQIADMYAWEVAQRRDGEWEGPAPARRLDAFGPGCQFLLSPQPAPWTLPGLPPGAEVKVGLSADHGEKANKEVWLLWVWIGTRRDSVIWVIDEYISPGRTSIEQDAQGVVGMMAPWGLTPSHADIIVGDTNSSGKGDVLAETVNQRFQMAFDDLGYPARVQSADKGADSVALGALVLNDGFATGRLWINQLCGALCRAAGRWDGGNDKFKDCVDSLRYGPGSQIEPVLGAARAARMVPGVEPVPTDDWFAGDDLWDGAAGF